MLFQIIGQKVSSFGLGKESTNICLASMAKPTKGQYKSHLQNFSSFCSDRGITDFFHVECKVGIEFVPKLFKYGKAYSTNSARSAISQFISIIDTEMSFGSHPLTNRFMKGVYKLDLPNRSTHTLGMYQFY